MLIYGNLIIKLVGVAEQRVKEELFNKWHLGKLSIWKNENGSLPHI